MIAARSLVVGVVVFHELRSVLRQRLDDSSGKRVYAVPVVLDTLGVELTAGLVAGIGIVSRIEIAVGCNPAHVVHRRSHRGLDAGVYGSCIDRQAAPAADSQDADALR